MDTTSKHPLVLIAFAAIASSWGHTPTSKPPTQEPNYLWPDPGLEACSQATLTDQLEDGDLQSGRTAPPVLASAAGAQPVFEVCSERLDPQLRPQALAQIIDQAPKQDPPPSPLA